MCGPHTFPSSEQWYLRDEDDGDRGPFSASELGRWLDANRIGEDALVRRDKSQEWYTVGRVAGIPLVLRQPPPIQLEIAPDPKGPGSVQDIGYDSETEVDSEIKSTIDDLEAGVDARLSRVKPVITGVTPYPVPSFEDLLQVLEERGFWP